MRTMFVTALAAGSLWAGQALAVNTEGLDQPYGGLSYGHEFGDESRNSDDGQGFQVTLGVPLSVFTDFSANNALELTYFGMSRARNLDGNDDYQNSVMLDFVHDFGLFGWGDEESWIPRFKPFVLAGLGGVGEDALGEKEWNVGFDLGAGLLAQLPWYNLALRTEWRVQSQMNDASASGEDKLVDHRVTVGAQWPLPFMGEPRRSEPPPPEECEVAVVDPVTGRTDCAVGDTDRDGVSDGLDQCPGTPEGMLVEASGCAAGVAGPDADSDGDRVPDVGDACPETRTGLVVDTAGCAVQQTMVLQGVLFQPNSAELTPDARKILDEVAATMARQPNLQIEIGGHTDAIGSQAFNLLLSQQRAESSRQYLIGRGVESGRLTAQGYGEFAPIGSNETEEGRMQNRRVEFKLIVQ